MKKDTNRLKTTKTINGKEITSKEVRKSLWNVASISIGVSEVLNANRKKESTEPISVNKGKRKAKKYLLTEKTYNSVNVAIHINPQCADNIRYPPIPFAGLS